MIAFLIREIDVRGGTHKQFLELLNYTHSQGEDFVILTKRIDLGNTYPGFSKYADKIRIVRDLPSMRWWKRFTYGWPLYIKYFRGLLSGVDVVNIHDCGFERYFWLLFGKKVVWQINDLPFAFCEGVAKSFLGKEFERRGARWIRNVTRRFIDLITVNVSKNAERVKRHFDMDAKVLYCGISPIAITHDNEETANRFRQNRVRLLSSGVFFPYRNYETLVESVELLRAKGIDAELNIFGATRFSPDYCQKIQEMIDQKELGQYIRILGQIDDAKYRELHEQSDMFCFVNVDQSWGLAVFEAMSAGLPVIVSRSVGATEILHDGIDATFVDPMDATAIAEKILKLMGNSDLYACIQKAGVELVRKYSWEEAYCKPMLDIIRDRKRK